jgi:hypothetical protein
MFGSPLFSKPPERIFPTGGCSLKSLLVLNFGAALTSARVCGWLRLRLQLYYQLQLRKKTKNVTTIVFIYHFIDYVPT